MKKHDFCKWTSYDQDGRFTFVGEVIDIEDEGKLLLNTEFGLIGVHPNDGVTEQVEKPEKWGVPQTKTVHLATSATTISKPTKPRAPRAPRVSGKPSKKEMALDIYRKMMDGGIHPQRKEVIGQLVSRLEMTPAGASTYAAVCKKECS